MPHCDPVVNEYDQMYAIRGGPGRSGVADRHRARPLTQPTLQRPGGARAGTARVSEVPEDVSRNASRPRLYISELRPRSRAIRDPGTPAAPCAGCQPRSDIAKLAELRAPVGSRRKFA